MARANGMTKHHDQPKEGLMRHTPLKELETPQVIHALLKRQGRLPAEARDHLERHLKLSYYFGGLNVAAKETDQGLAVVASGPGREVRAALDALKKKDREGVTILFPETWEEMFAGFCQPTGPRTR